jgi:hypothetical protein
MAAGFLIGVGVGTGVFTLGLAPEIEFRFKIIF